MIPSIIHQIWLGAPIPKKIMEYMEKARQAAKTYYLWGNAVFDELGTTREEFSAYWNINASWPVALSDVLRILLVKKYGGFYLDADAELLKTDLSDLAGYSFVADKQGPIAANAFFGAEPEHPCLEAILSEMEALKAEPVHFTKRVGYLMRDRVIKSRNDVHIIDVSDKIKHHSLYSWSDYGRKKFIR